MASINPMHSMPSRKKNARPMLSEQSAVFSKVPWSLEQGDACRRDAQFTTLSFHWMHCLTKYCQSLKPNLSVFAEGNGKVKDEFQTLPTSVSVCA
tara:strand:+ start:1406 stop:1690 length:285 start_codon:yes stop_codon:yes gene_type:complete